MEALTLAQLLQAVGGTLIGGEADLNQTVTEVCTDSRSVPQGCLFLPLEGERFDGHSFINSALEQGAVGCVTARERESYLPGKFYIKVRSTQRALRDLARYYKLGGQDHHQGHGGGGAGGQVQGAENRGQLQQ